MSKRRQKYSDSQSEGNQQSFSDQTPPKDIQPNSTQKIQRTKRNNVIQRNYQQDFSQNEHESKVSSEGEYIFFKGGRVSKVLAERKRSGTNAIQRLCKFYSKSYLHVKWLTDLQIKEQNIQMLRQTKRTIQAAKQHLQQIQQKYGKQYFFNPSYTRVDRILTTAVLFPAMHHKKGSEMNGKWSESMMLVCSKILNFQKDNIPYGIIEKDDYHAEDTQQVKQQSSKTKIEHIINRLYLDKYKNPQEFWADVGQSIRVVIKDQNQTGRQQDAEILKQCIIFLYWQWFCLSKQKFLAFLPKETVYQKLRKDLENQNCEVYFKFQGREQNYNFDELLKQNIFIVENYTEKPATEKQLLLLHPGVFSYAWLNRENNQQNNILETTFSHLSINDIKKLSLNVQIDPLYLIKWCDLDYDQVTWEKQSDLECAQKIRNFKLYSKVPSKKDRQKVEELKKCHKIILGCMTEPQKMKANYQNLQKYRRQLYHLHKSTKQVKQYGGQDIPIYKDYKILKNFQLEGLNWLIRSWHENRNCILADEMGLGKTIQTIAFLNHLHVFEHVIGPFLVVAPVSTLKQWRNQIQQWSDLNCVLYKGKLEARGLIEQYEFYHKFVTNEGIFIKFQKMPRFQVLLTNYEIFLSDIDKFQKIAFQHIIFDEAHKIKNSKSKIAMTLKLLPCPRILLLTGTPIQNNTSEIFGLLNVIEPKKFNSLQLFKQRFGNLKTVQELAQLKQTLKPYLMRRVKSDVQKSIPKLSQMLVALDLTTTQKAYYKGVIQKNKNHLLKSLTAASINNISLCLRQISNHPYMLSEETEDEITRQCETQEQRVQKLINASSKMIFVHKFLTKCKTNKSKTLVFTQFLKMMDCLKYYCISQNILYESLDGSVNYQERQNRIDRFNKNPQVLVFIISTKAGGIGINLTSATNIIIYDSDWNPQNDIQAIARAHRIGQLKNVTVYRLITTQTYEDHLYKSAVKKLGIGLAILDNEYFNNKSASQNTKKQKSRDQIEKLLKDGVLGFLKQQEHGEEIPNIQNQSIQEIISKSSTTVDYQTKDCSFTKTKFQHEENNININDPNFWQVALENIQSPLQKLVKKLKNQQETKKIFENFEEQCILMIQANEVVYNFVKSKVSMSHFNAQDERQLRAFLQKISYSRQFHRQYKSIVNDWLEQIEKPSRRFEKQQISFLQQIIHKNDPTPTTRLVRNRSKKGEPKEEQNDDQKNSRTQGSRNKRQIQSSQNQEEKNQSLQNLESLKKRSKKDSRPKRNSSRLKLQQSDYEQQQQKIQYIKKELKTQQDYKQLIEENVQIYLESICCFCERKVCSKLCKGRCRRTFHKLCYQRYKQRSQDVPSAPELQQQLKMSKQQICVGLSEIFQCFECVLGEALCFICGTIGQAVPSIWAEKGAPKNPLRLSQDPKSKNQIEFIYDKATPYQKRAVFQCRMDYCTRTYHLKCLKDMKKELQFQLYANKEEGSYPLKCPCHFCSSCGKKLSIMKSSCLRCPVSYHKHCMSQKKSFICQVDSEWFICKAHINEDDLQRKKDENDILPKTGNEKKKKIEQKKIEKQVKEALKEENKHSESKSLVSNKLDVAFKNVEQKKTNVP